MISSNQRHVPARKNDLRGTLADTCKAKELLGELNSLISVRIKDGECFSSFLIEKEAKLADCDPAGINNII